MFSVPFPLDYKETIVINHPCISLQNKLFFLADNFSSAPGKFPLYYPAN